MFATHTHISSGFSPKRPSGLTHRPAKRAGLQRGPGCRASSWRGRCCSLKVEAYTGMRPVLIFGALADQVVASLIESYPNMFYRCSTYVYSEHTLGILQWANVLSNFVCSFSFVWFCFPNFPFYSCVPFLFIIAKIGP